MLMKTIIFILCSIILTTQALISYKSGYCPIRQSVHKCMPKCKSDYECTFNEKCCLNICGTHSCALPSATSTGSDGGYKGSSSDTAVYCNGQKCNKYEKCEFDRRTKREKCVRT